MTILKTRHLSLLLDWRLKDQASMELISDLVRADPPSGSRELRDTDAQQPASRDCESSDRLRN